METPAGGGMVTAMGWNWATLVAWIGIVIGGVLLSGGLATAIILNLPVDYFTGTKRAPFLLNAHPAWRWTVLVLKNLGGAVLVLLGLVLSIPGVPGQGFLTILAGLMLLDFPGKFRLERRLVSIPSLGKAVNWIRARVGKEPMELPVRRTPP